MDDKQPRSKALQPEEQELQGTHFGPHNTPVGFGRRILWPENVKRRWIGQQIERGEAQWVALVDRENNDKESS